MWKWGKELTKGESRKCSGQAEGRQQHVGRGCAAGLLAVQVVAKVGDCSCQLVHRALVEWIFLFLTSIGSISCGRVLAGPRSALVRFAGVVNASQANNCRYSSMTHRSIDLILQRV